MWIQIPVHYDKSVYTNTCASRKRVHCACRKSQPKSQEGFRKKMLCLPSCAFQQRITMRKFQRNAQELQEWKALTRSSPSESASSAVCCSADLKSIFPVPSLVPGLLNARTQHRGGNVCFEQDTESGLRSVSPIWHGGPFGKASSSWSR